MADVPGGTKKTPSWEVMEEVLQSIPRPIDPDVAHERYMQVMLQGFLTRMKVAPNS